MVSLVPAESGDDARLSGSVTGGELGGGNGLRRNSGPGRCRAMRAAALLHTRRRAPLLSPPLSERCRPAELPGAAGGDARSSSR